MEASKSFFHKDYGYIKALDNIYFNINKGEVVGYIGPNGAGKSSTIKVLSGILGPDSGECYIDGKVPWKDRINYVKNIWGVFGQRLQLWWDVPVIDSFSLLKDIYLIFYKDDLKFTYTQSIINNLIYLTPNNPKVIMKDGKIVLKGHKFTEIIKEDIISEKNRITEILECSI